MLKTKHTQRSPSPKEPLQTLILLLLGCHIASLPFPTLSKKAIKLLLNVISSDILAVLVTGCFTCVHCVLIQPAVDLC